jgi:lysophospholipase L1-like esterase
MTRFFCLVLSCLASCTSAAEPAPVRIMAVGDSITQGGGKTFATYRIPLADKLKAAGLRCEFVGSRPTEGSPSPLWHEGYGGKNAEYLASILEAKLKAHPADVVMLQAGHNHFVEEKPVAGIVAAHRDMVATARKLNPRVVVFIAQVIPSGKLPKYAYIPELNAALAGLVKELHRPEQPVYLVDLATGFDPAKDTIADLVHPNAAGAEKIAQRWNEALAKGLK